MDKKQWHHAPSHYFPEKGAYIVTAGTYQKAHVFRSAAHLDFLTQNLLELAVQYGWEMQAWAVFSNHYHFVALSPEDPGSLREYVKHLHSVSAREANRLDGIEGRQVWFEYWDTFLTFEKSYLARLNYIHQNPVKHGLVRNANEYSWCSAGWFEKQAFPSFYRTVSSFKTDLVKVSDAYEPILVSK